MILYGENFKKIISKPVKEIKKGLQSMKDRGNSFVILEDYNGDYVQAGGNGIKFIVEVRVYNEQSEFRHYRAQNKNINQTVFIRTE